MTKKMASLLENYFSLEIVSGRRIRIPYFRNKFLKNGKRIQGPFGGKGAPLQIKNITLKKAQQKKVNLKNLSPLQVRSFMKQEKIGLDCSGFAFQILNHLKPGFYKGLKLAPGKSKNPIRRLNAKMLTSPINTKKVVLKDAKVGDVVPVAFSGKDVDHVLVIVYVGKNEIVYAHSSSKGKVTGPHLGKIKVTDWKKDVAKQIWSEKTKEGEVLSKYLFGNLRRIDE